MSERELIEKFMMMFPDWNRKAISYKQIGPRALVINYKDKKSKVFLYYNDNNWQFGTKLWRRRPTKVEKKMNNIKEEVKNENS